jgi:hypothetical protein
MAEISREGMLAFQISTDLRRIFIPNQAPDNQERNPKHSNSKDYFNLCDPTQCIEHSNEHLPETFSIHQPVP